jgi:pimeloyl-ACP methyl ester carboxylesterase
MTFLQRLADRLILKPTTHHVDPGDLKRRVILTMTGEVEAWTASQEPKSTADTKVLLLKFPGTGGRAERSGLHPAEAWDDIACRTWTINHRGYGRSSGPASTQNFAETCDAVFAKAIEVYPDHKIAVYGNSLGCISALYIAARYTVAGAYLRNPPPLAEMIATRPRYAAWSFGFSRLIAEQVSFELDSLANASQASCPALFIQSELDRVVPTKYQDLVIEKYSGEVCKFILRGANHHQRAADSQKGQYVEALCWLGQQIVRYDSQ